MILSTNIVSLPSTKSLCAYIEHSKSLLLTPSSNALPGPKTIDRHPQDFKKHPDSLPSSLQRAAAPHKQPASAQLVPQGNLSIQPNPRASLGTGEQLLAQLSWALSRTLPCSQTCQAHTDPVAEGSVHRCPVSQKLPLVIWVKKHTTHLFKIKTFIPPYHTSNELAIQLHFHSSKAFSPLKFVPKILLLYH